GAQKRPRRKQIRPTTPSLSRVVRVKASVAPPGSGGIGRAQRQRKQRGPAARARCRAPRHTPCYQLASTHRPRWLHPRTTSLLSSASVGAVDPIGLLALEARCCGEPPRRFGEGSAAVVSPCCGALALHGP